jgi:hypothetical protein
MSWLSNGLFTAKTQSSQSKISQFEFRNPNFCQLRVLSASALKTVADPSFGGSVVNYPNKSEKE